MGWFGIQFRQILRRLGRTPMFTGITLVTLAVGVGANTAIFSVLEGVLLKPLPYPTRRDWWASGSPLQASTSRSCR